MAHMTRKKLNIVDKQKNVQCLQCEIGANPHSNQVGIAVNDKKFPMFPMLKSPGGAFQSC